MSAAPKQLSTSEAVAAELWRIAESGDVNELLRLLPRVGNVNVRNRHGMTALMKAAFYGHEPAVRTLLQHGADPNLTRNDKFTALALAAFFGHAETVNTLIAHGARTEVVTRCGASARTWAAARTFDEVARCLETHSRTPAAPVAVKTLKDPPEIWDLVHEVPRNFNARSAFFSRVATMKRTFAVGVFAGLILIICGGAGALVLRRSQARDLAAEIPPLPTPVESTVSEPAPSAQVVAENPQVEIVNDNHARGVSNRARMLIRQPRSSSVINPEPAETTQQSREAAAVASPRFESTKPAEPAVKTTPVNPLSPQVISPPKNSPPKAKVIQWP